MTITLTNKMMEREADSLIVEYTAREEVADSATPAPGGEDATNPQYENFRNVAEALVQVTKEEVGEQMTRELEADADATAALRAARKRMRRGEFRTQEDVERD